MPKLRFTEPFVRTVESDRQKEYCEDGLCLRVYATGRKVWFLPYRNQEGRFRRLKLGTYPALSLKQARSLARSRRGEVEQGADPQAERMRGREAEATFARLASLYMENHAKAKKRSWKEDQRILEKDLLPAWKDRPAESITRKEIAQLVERIARRGAPVMANRTLALVGKICTFGVEREILEHNPRVGLSWPAKEKPRDRTLTMEEIKLVWKALDTFPVFMGALFRVLLFTGQRSTPAMQMRKTDITGDVWTIPAEVMKSHHEHRVFLSPQCQEVLDRCVQEAPESPWVFPSPKKQDSPINSMGKALVRLRDVCGLHFTRHDLRRTCATHLSRLGCPRHLLIQVLDHSDGSVTSIYDRYSYDEELREWMGRWGREVERVTTTENEAPSRPKAGRSRGRDRNRSAAPGMAGIQP